MLKIHIFKQFGTFQSNYVYVCMYYVSNIFHIFSLLLIKGALLLPINSFIRVQRVISPDTILLCIRYSGARPNQNDTPYTTNYRYNKVKCFWIKLDYDTRIIIVQYYSIIIYFIFLSHQKSLLNQAPTSRQFLFHHLQLYGV